MTIVEAECNRFNTSHGDNLAPMRLAEKLLQLSKVMHRWLELLTGMELSRRARIADYADDIAATLGRAAQALAQGETEPDNLIAARTAAMELGRISGYVEDIVGLLRDQLDGRKLAGVKRRLETLGGIGLSTDAEHMPGSQHIEQLAQAQGYFHALADRLRV